MDDKQQLICKALGLSELPQTKEELDAALLKLEKLEMESLKDVAPSLPKAPAMNSGSMSSRLQKLQRFIEDFQYNHTGRKFINLKKTEGMYRVSRTSKQIIQDGLPIKCIEAVFLGAYLTLGCKTMLRMPIAFKSRVNGDNTFQHIVMAVSHGSLGDKKWGAIGLSRAKSLMYKPTKFNSLASLLYDYKVAYQKEHHELLHIYVGLPFGRDEYNQIPIQWRVLRLNVEVMPWSAVEQVLATYTTNATRHLSAYMSTQQLPDEMNELYAGHLEPSATKILSQSPKCSSKKAWMTPKSPKSSKSPNKVKKKKTKKKKKVKKKTVSSSSPEGKKENAETKVEQNEEEDNDEGGGGEAGEDNDDNDDNDAEEDEDEDEEDDDDEEDVQFAGEEKEVEVEEMKGQLRKKESMSFLAV
jgi:tubulinyl-Tyr carboxypeptidase